MSPVTILGLLCSMVFFYSCAKERVVPGAALAFRFGGSTEEVEWMEVAGSRYASSGNCYIIADGFDSDQFHLDLENIVSPGVVQNITSKNISYSNIYGFKTGSLQSVQIKIVATTKHRLQGNFNVTFINSSNNTETINASGSFTIYGYEQ